MQLFDLLAQAPASGGGSGTMTLVMMVLMFGGMYFLLIAPQRKKQKQHEKMLKELESGEEVITIGGIYGTITNVKDDRFVLKVADGTKIEITKSSIGSRASEPEKK